MTALSSKPRFLNHKSLLLALCLLWSSSSLYAQAPARSNQEAEQPLTNAAIIKLVRAGFSDKSVIAIISARPTRFQLTPDNLVELKQRKVSERVILAMLARTESDLATIADDAWTDDDDFFSDGLRGGARRRAGERNESDPKAGDSQAGETNIFGSQGGSRGSTRSRAGNSTNDGDTQTTGSATVRIVRPPTETGNAAPKLERTASLTNNSIVELVEAGFTEGTIIRRIEQSPAEYDLTPAKLADLRRRRVSESVIAAMRLAMSDDSPTAQP